MTQQQQQQPQQIVEKTQNGHTGGGFVDLMNLYVKNLDPTINNNDLFNLFRQFGRIVSARVMTNPTTGQSKGYGFVSYGKPEEAALALNEMDGMLVRSKQIIVAYHEPKKPRQEKSSSTTTSSFHSPPSTAPPMEYVNAPYFETRYPHEGNLGFENLYVCVYIDRRSRRSRSRFRNRKYGSNHVEGTIRWYHNTHAAKGIIPFFFSPTWKDCTDFFFV